MEVPVHELVGAVEIAERLGVAGPKRVHDWRYRNTDFPAPVTKVGAVYVWRWPEVEAWAKRTGRLK
jgi:hypothetical protein